MSSRVPRCNNSVTQITCGQNESTVLNQGGIEWLLASEGHSRLANGAWSSGGPFYKVSHKVELQKGPTLSLKGYGNPIPWQGSVGPAVGYSALPSQSTVRQSAPSFASTTANLMPYYAKGWAKTRPGNPVANVAQTLIELRDFPMIPGATFTGFGWRQLSSAKARRKLFSGVPFSEVPKIARNRVNWFRSLGSEYLNVVFGWKPFVQDLIDIYNVMKSIDKQMAQIKRDNGNGIRRSGSVTDDHSSSTTQTAYPYQWANTFGTPPAWTPGSTVYTKTTTTKTRRWYVAKYQYYIPDTSSWQWDARARAVLFGALPTPSVVWEVLPWSWMVDWFTNVGDVMSNASVNAVDNLVALYSYIMEHKTTTVECTSVSQWESKYNQYWAYPGGSCTSVGKSTVETKARCGGSPFGMGITFSGLSAGQGAILAALGLSRF